jgi:hypothetical protein
MSERGASEADARGSGCYEIRIAGHLDQRWADRLEGLSFTHEGDGTTNLHGSITDQAALHGVLNRIRDLGLPIISIQRIGAPAKAIGEENS